jgi:hypothetical protein
MCAIVETRGEVRSFIRLFELSAGMAWHGVILGLRVGPFGRMFLGHYIPASPGPYEDKCNKKSVL